MSDKPTTPEEEDEANLALLVTYFREKQKDRYFGTIEISMQDGEAKHVRENRARPIPALASQLWDKLPEKFKDVLKKKFIGSSAFDVD